MSEPIYFRDPYSGTQVIFDDAVAVEIPLEDDLTTVLERAGWYSRTELDPSKVNAVITVFAQDDDGTVAIHPRFAHRTPSPEENVWAWVHTLGGGDDEEVLLAIELGRVEALAAAQDYDAPAKEVF